MGVVAGIIPQFADAEVGRWISEDPIGFKAGDVSLYRYINNKSIYLSDPYGLFLCWTCSPYSLISFTYETRVYGTFSLGASTNPFPASVEPATTLLCEKVKITTEGKTCTYYTAFSSWSRFYTRKKEDLDMSWNARENEENFYYTMSLNGHVSLPINVGVGIGYSRIAPDEMQRALQLCNTQKPG